MHFKDVTKESIYKIGRDEQMKMKSDFKSRSFEQQWRDVEGKRIRVLVKFRWVYVRRKK